ncbi:hypothetical protein HOR67_gp47 [Ralstonia phage RS-PI-1]|uniref:Uncharacterized protein n=1 Tax=Ralstonia phage RS-PI-1 TaxID=1958965 RepID=A0A1S6L1E9_9CAUD|nr:hypothetical protein HOR67_gp47 [Ralstonia phage RS-PI-1]AQT27809.1 hypothetical protein [Ralstonia phage RS-PI-1]
MSSIITIDERFPECTALDTDKWLDAVLGSEVNLDSATKYVVGYNMPGYMPDMEPAEFDDAQSALSQLRDYLQERLDELEDEGAAEALGFSDEQIDALREALDEDPDDDGEIAFTVCGFAYWIKAETRSLEEVISGKWLMQAEDDIKAAIEAEMGEEYEFTRVDNTYNNENDFSSNFQWQVFYPAGSSDWVYADRAYVAIEVHQGGDVRGNYGRIRLFSVDDLADSGFLDWVLGWNVEYSDGTQVPENDRFSIGYASNPWCEMVDHIKGGDRGLRWSEKHEAFVGWYEDGRAVKVTPYTYAG